MVEAGSRRVGAAARVTQLPFGCYNRLVVSGSMVGEDEARGTAEAADRPGVRPAAAAPAVALLSAVDHLANGGWRPPEYRLEIGRTYVRLERSGHVGYRGVRKVWAWDPSAEEPVDIEIRAGTDRGGHRGDGGLQVRSAAAMRRTFQSLPWETLRRPALISLTYPGDWRRWVRDGRQLERHRTTFRRRWQRRWEKPLVGVWVKEFQRRGAPHLHLYVGLPDAVSEEEIARLRRRAIEGKWLEGQYGSYGGRSRVRWGRWEGDFVPWLRTTWAEIVGTQGITRDHHGRGVDVRVFFFTDAEERTRNRDRVAQYLAAEASKWQQKAPPEGFRHVGRYWGVWGRSQGFRPDVETVELDHRVGYEMQLRLARWVRLKLLAQGRTLEGFDRRRDGDGVTALGLTRADYERLLGWCERAVQRKVERRGLWGPRRRAPTRGGLPVEPYARPGCGP